MAVCTRHLLKLPPNPIARRGGFFIISNATGLFYSVKLMVVSKGISLYFATLTYFLATQFIPFQEYFFVVFQDAHAVGALNDELIIKGSVTVYLASAVASSQSSSFTLCLPFSCRNSCPQIFF